MTITIEKGLSAEHWTALTGWAPNVFPIEGRSVEWAPLRWHVVARNDGQPVAHLGFDRFTVMAGDRHVSLVGVGGVVVRPEFQKQGLPAKLFEKLHTDCPTDIRSDTFCLFCPDGFVSYYQKHGYEKVERAVKILQGGKAMATAFVLMARGDGLAKTGPEIRLTSRPW